MVFFKCIFKNGSAIGAFKVRAATPSIEIVLFRLDLYTPLVS